MSSDSLERILVVDDDSSVRDLARLALAEVGGFTVRVCASGAEAIAACGEFQPDLVLLDEFMPDLDGLDTLQALRELPETAHVPVVFLTAKTGGADVRRYRSAGAAGLIAKPFSPLALSDDVLKIWNSLTPPRN